jgi:hypothetical protein
MTMRFTAIAIALALCLAGCGKHPTGRYDAVPVPSSISHRINAHGIRVAKAADGAQQRWFFMHADGSRDAIAGLPGGAQVTGINDKEELTGYVPAPGCKTDKCSDRAFIWSAGNFRDLGTLGAISVLPETIDNRGDIAGSMEVVSAHPAQCSDSTAHSEFHPFVYSRGKVSDLGAPPGDCGMVLRLNDNKDALIVYTHIDASGRHVEFNAFYRDGKVTALPGKGMLTAYEIDANGNMVGARDTADGNYHAVVVRRDGSVEDLGTGGYCCSDALGINDDGMIVGYVDTGKPSQDAAKHSILHAVIFRDGKIVDLNGLIDWSAADRARILTAGLADFVAKDGEILCQVYDARGKFVGMYILRPEMK